MLTPLRRWTRDQPLSSVPSWMRKVLCGRRHSLWVLLILLVVCVAIQTFVARQARNDKVTGSPPQRFTVNKEQVFPSLRNVRAGLRAESALTAKKEVTSPQAERTAKLEETKSGQSAKPPGHIPPNYVGTAIDPSRGSRLLSNGKTLSPGPPDPLVLRGVTKTLIDGKTKRPVDSPPALSPKMAPVKNVYTKPTCRPKSHVVFLKTHKTASSTILNILYRYGESKNLTFALPVNKHSQLFYPFFFASYFVEGVSSRSVSEFHIMCNHMRFRKSEVAKVMPADTFYFSILRHPVGMMESIFTYYKSIPAFHNTRSLDDFLNNSWHNYNSSLSNNHYAHNILAFDFGFDNNVTGGAEDLEGRASLTVAYIERDFHLILISEYFDESMILLKHALCWTLDDVVSFRLNSRSAQTRHPLSPSTADKIKMWNALDWRIYVHFNATFWHKVDHLVGREQMKVEVSQLRERQAALANICLKDGGAVDPSQVKDTGLKPFQYGAAVIQGYNLNPDLDNQTRTICQRLITPELQYTDHLYNQQFPQLALKHKQAAKMAAHRQRRGALRRPRAKEVHLRHKLTNLRNRRASTSIGSTHTANMP